MHRQHSLAVLLPNSLQHTLSGRERVVGLNDETGAEVKTDAPKPPGYDEFIAAGAKFDGLNLGPKKDQLLHNIYTGMGWQVPSKIQAAALPHILSEKRPSLLGQARNGSGKTGAFTLGALAAVDPTKDQVQALIMSPTRLLADDLARVVSKMAEGTGIRVGSVVRGVTFTVPVSHHVVIATPGKLKHLMNAEPPLIDLSAVRVFVLDEADDFLINYGSEMVAMRKKMADAQVLLFSASFFVLKPDSRPAKLCSKLLQSAHGPPVRLQVTDPTELAVSTLTHMQMQLDASAEPTCRTTTKTSLSQPDWAVKKRFIVSLYDKLDAQTLLFCSTKVRVQDLADELRKLGTAGSSLTVGVLDASMEGELVTKTIADFNAGKLNVVVATHWAARGLDIPTLQCVINVDLPMSSTTPSATPPPSVEGFLHCCGRVARKGQRGVALSLLHGKHDQAAYKELVEKFHYEPLVASSDPEKLSEQIEALL